MSRPLRSLPADHCFHVTVRCNNREFRLTRFDCRAVLLYALDQTRSKFGFKLFGLCIMSNHVHYLIYPQQPEDLPRIMHWINWYTAMSFNQMMNRTGHFWEKRYHSTAFPLSDHRRALNTLRYIHANPKAAGMQLGFFYDFSNYGIYDRLTDDGMTQWHPAFLNLGKTLEECAEKYRQFCNRYRPQPKPERKRRWGSRKFAGFQVRGKPKRSSPGQLAMWEQLLPLKGEEILEVARKFVEANCYDPNDRKQVPGIGFGR